MTKSQLLRLLQTQCPDLYHRYITEEVRILASRCNINAKQDRLEFLDRRYETLLNEQLQEGVKS